jgi:putative peptidoglycan lipid II flippase
MCRRSQRKVLVSTGENRKAAKSAASKTANGMVRVDFQKSLLGGTLVIMLFTGITKVLGFVREQALAAAFGASSQTDAYLVAATIPSLLIGTLVGAIGAAFLPVYKEECGRGPGHSARRLTLTLGRFLIAGSILIGAFALAFAPDLVGILAPGLAPDTKALAAWLTRIMAPGMVFLTLSGLTTALLHAKYVFSWPAAAQAVMNMVVIAAILVLGRSLGIAAAALGMLAGMAAQLAVQLPWIGRLGGQPTPKGSPYLPLAHPLVQRVLTLSVPLVIGGLAGQAYLLIDRNLASHLPSGSIAALSFANRLAALPVSLIATAVAASAYPRLADVAGRWRASASMRDPGAKKVFGATLVRSLSLCLSFLVPAATGLVLLRTQVVRLLYERGAFDAAATALTSTILAGYAPGLIAHGVNQVLVLGFYARQNTKHPMILGVGAVLLNAVLAWVLTGLLGALGLAVANTLASWALTFVLVYVLWRNGWLSGMRHLVLDGVRVALATGVMMVVAWLSLGVVERLGSRLPLPMVLSEAGIPLGVALTFYVLLIWPLLWRGMLRSFIQHPEARR